MKFSKKIENLFLGTKLHYWTTPRVFVRPKVMRDIDIIWDDIGIQIPNDGWKDLDPELKRLFILHRHRGIRIFSSVQDYKQVDIMFRRMVGNAYKVEKLIGSRDISATMPPVRFVWGLIMKRRFDPENIEINSNQDKLIEKEKFLISIPKFFTINKRLTSAYDTTQEIEKHASYRLNHQEWKCTKRSCGKVHVDHQRIL